VTQNLEKDLINLSIKIDGYISKEIKDKSIKMSAVGFPENTKIKEIY